LPCGNADAAKNTVDVVLRASQVVSICHSPLLTWKTLVSVVDEPRRLSLEPLTLNTN